MRNLFGRANWYASGVSNVCCQADKIVNVTWTMNIHLALILDTITLHLRRILINSFIVGQEGREENMGVMPTNYSKGGVKVVAFLTSFYLNYKIFLSFKLLSFIKLMF